MTQFKRAVPVAVAINDDTYTIPQDFLNANILNRHLTGSITITFPEVNNQPSTSFELLAGEQFIMEHVGEPYDALGIDATGSSVVIIYTKV